MTEETAKERIKRKKKERAEATKFLEEQAGVEKVPINDDCLNETEVLNIYPSPKKKPKLLAQGSVKIKIPKIGIELRNIVYKINAQHTVHVQPPFKYYPFPEEPEKADAYVPSIKFYDKSIWKEAISKIQEAVLEHHKDDLPPLEEPPK